MNKKVIFSAMMMLVLLASCGAKDSTTSESASSSTAQETSSPADSSIAAEIDEPVFLSQGFAEYDESLIGETTDTVLFFHAEWCGSCKTAEASLISEDVPTDLTVLKIDFDAAENTELRQKYWVTTKHTFVQIDADGNEIKKWSGSMDLADIIDNVAGEAMMEKTESEDAMMKKDEDAMEKEDEKMMKDESTEEVVMEKTELAWVYSDYNESLVGQTDTTVLAFFAAWCPSCVAADKGITGGTVPSDLSILKVDFDSATDLRKKYGVTSQHTFVQVDADGTLIKKWAGGTTVEDVVERVQ